MTSFVSLVMQAAADECHGAAAQIEEEVQRLLSEVEHTIEDADHDVFWERFLELLKRRAEITRKARILLREKRVLFDPDGANMIWKHSQAAQHEQLGRDHPALT